MSPVARPSIIPAPPRSPWSDAAVLALRRASRDGRHTPEQRDGLRSAAWRMAQCRHAVAVGGSFEAPELQVQHCNVRTCYTCAPHRTAETQRKLRETLEDEAARRRTRGLVDIRVTVPGDYSGGEGAYRVGERYLTAALRVLRESPEWRRRARGWFAALEHPWHGGARGWHWHAHLIVDTGRPWPLHVTCSRSAGLCAGCARAVTKARDQLRRGKLTRARWLWWRAMLRRWRGGCGVDYGFAAVWQRACESVYHGGRCLAADTHDELLLTPRTDPSRIITRGGDPGTVSVNVQESLAHRLVTEGKPVAKAAAEVSGYLTKGDMPPPHALVQWQLEGAWVQRFRWGGAWRGRRRRRPRRARQIRMTRPEAEALLDGRSRKVTVTADRRCGDDGYKCAECKGKVRKIAGDAWARGAPVLTASGTPVRVADAPRVVEGCGRLDPPRTFRVPRRMAGDVAARWLRILSSGRADIDAATMRREDARSKRATKSARRRAPARPRA